MTLLPIHFTSGGAMIKATEVTIADVARYILEKSGQMTTMKLQKLCYYAQVWHCYHLERRLFKEEVQAWAYGPVSYDLFELHRGKYQITADEMPVCSTANLSVESATVIDQVLNAYGAFTGAQLSDLSHSETPWIETRSQVTEQSQSPVITIEKMYEFAVSTSAKG
jgi:uncharacterized phage-associated protein